MENEKRIKNMDDQLINKFISELDDEDREVRINAISQLGETGDELCLKELRERLKNLSQEHLALIIAVGKLKKELGIK
jgi:HEAT repeat protein